LPDIILAVKVRSEELASECNGCQKYRFQN
jgi:hypothetical protein